MYRAHLFRLVRSVVESLRYLNYPRIVVLPSLVRRHYVTVPPVSRCPIYESILHALRVIRTLEEVQHPDLPKNT